MVSESGDIIQPVQVLYLEDNPQDVELVEATLAAEGIACNLRWVETQSSFQQALAQPELHLILSDYSLPTFDGLSALTLAREQRSDVPFIFVSGAIGEERAIESLKQGATDYVLKQRLTRLGPAVRRALREAAERSTRQRAQAELGRAQETERIRIARELHDGVAQSLSAMIFHIDFLRTRAGDPAKVKTLLDEMKEALTQAVTDIRDVVWALRPGMLDDLGLREALHALATQVRRRTAMAIMLELPHEMPLLSLAVETALYRIVQEALTNAARHGQADQATIHLDLHPKKAHLTVRDTGKGFDATRLPPPSPMNSHNTAENTYGIGLWSMRARAEEVGGTFALHSTPGYGTTIHVTVPIQPKTQ